MKTFNSATLGYICRINTKMIKLGCLAFVLSVVQSLNAQSPAAPTELLSVVKPGFEIYAPRQADLARAVEPLEHAAREYKRYFGKDAPKIAVVLYDTPQQALKYDKAEFRKRGMGLLKLPAMDHIPPKVIRSTILSVLLRESPADKRLMMLVPYPEGPVAGIDLQRGDILLSVNKQPIRNVEDLKREMDKIAVGSPVTLVTERGGQKKKLRFNKPEDKPDPSLETLWKIISRDGKFPVHRSIIAHEAMHQLVGDGLREGPNRHLPAWFSEGIASMAEFPDEREQSRKRIREHLKTRIELSKLFSMLHPASSGVIIPSGSPGSGVIIPSGPPTDGLPVMIKTNTPEGEKFYEQSMTLLEFLAETEGERFVGQIGEALIRNESMENVLQRARKSPKDLNGLDAAWVKWLTR